LQPNQWHQNIPLIRPLLRVYRKDILDYCDNRKIKFLEDPSNQNRKYRRNHIRHDLVPQLSKMNPNFKATLLRSAEIFRAENDAMGQFEKIAWQSCVIEGDNNLITISIAAFHLQPLAIKRRLLLRIFQQYMINNESISYTLIDEAMAFISSNISNHQIELAKKMNLMKENEWIYFFRNEEDLPFLGPQMKASESTSFMIPSEIRLYSGWKFSVKAEKIFEDSLSDPYSAYGNLSNMASIELRPRKAGDRFQPLGMKRGSMKITDFMINEKLPKRARKAWPLLAFRNDILWVPGYEISEKIRVEKSGVDSVHLVFSTDSSR